MTNSKNKASKPNLFYRDCTKLKHQLLQLNLYFYIIKKKKEQAKKNKVLLAATYIRERAAEQIRLYVTKYLKQIKDEGDQVDKIIKDYNKFVEELRTLFRIIN